MRIGIVGSGRIGGNAGRLFAQAGHEVLFSFSRDQAKLADLAEQAGHGARAGTPAEAAEFGEVVMLAVPWSLVDDALAATGDLDGKIVIDTTNQFTADGLQQLGDVSAARSNAQKAPAARWVKTFNTLTSGFQAQAAGRTGEDRVVLFLAGDDDRAKHTVAHLIDDAGFTPVDCGTLDRNDVGHMEPKGDLYGEEFHLADGSALVARLRGTPPSGRGRP